ncbi:rCG25196 [Rattus norvegicus]|uniref:RCG25196 n=1 Tax=Rattus norvegicus TaxID=10116 RepID=A6I1J4_RAT|nr:rCG25196 [Rattus norvegicus]
MALRRPARRTSFRTQLHRPRRRKNSAAARVLARQSSARSLAAASRGRGLAGLTNRRLQPRGRLDLYLLHL